KLRNRRGKQLAIFSVNISPFGRQNSQMGAHFMSKFPKGRTLFGLYPCGFGEDGSSQKADAGEGYVNPESYVLFYIQCTLSFGLSVSSRNAGRAKGFSPSDEALRITSDSISAFISWDLMSIYFQRSS